MQEKLKMISKIYTLSDSTGKDIFYVGCTKHDVSFRLMQHIREAAKSRNKESASPLTKAQKIHSLNYEVLITIVEVVESNYKAAAKEAEENWILHFLNKGYNLFNQKRLPKEEKIPETVGYSFSSKKLVSYTKLKKAI